MTWCPGKDRAAGIPLFDMEFTGDAAEGMYNEL